MLASISLLVLIAGAALAQSSAFTYQGRLTESTKPADGLYDMQFKLFDTPTVGTGTQQGATMTNSSVQVTNAVFSVQLEFGASVFDGSPRFLMNIYNGNTVLDRRGEAVVTLPDYFQALNRDFRYQLTCIGGFAPVYIAREIRGNSFKIAGGKPGMKVSWQVTGVRQDAYANAHRIPVEEVKPAPERGTYLHPDAFNKRSSEKRR